MLRREDIETADLMVEHDTGRDRNGGTKGFVVPQEGSDRRHRFEMVDEDDAAKAVRDGRLDPLQRIERLGWGRQGIAEAQVDRAPDTGLEERRATGLR